MPGIKKIYFLSDFHLGIDAKEKSAVREQRIVRFLRSVEQEVEHLYLMGDLFDFWFEYRHAVPKGHIRFLGQLARMADMGIPITIFKGNHDLWMRDYLQQEIRAEILDHSVTRVHCGYKLYLHHGDGLGPGDRGYKFIKKVFTNPFFQWLFRWLHPDWGISLARFFSGESSKKNRVKDQHFLGEDNEWLVLHCREMLEKEKHDYFIFGHRHLPLNIDLGQGARYINLGDWLVHYSYAVLDSNGLELKYIDLSQKPD